MCPQIRKCAGKCHLSKKKIIGIGIGYFSTKKNSVSSDKMLLLWIVFLRSSYPQLNGIVTLIQILQGGLEIVSHKNSEVGFDLNRDSQKNCFFMGLEGYIEFLE